MSDLIHRDYLEDCQQSRAALAERLATVEAERDRLREALRQVDEYVLATGQEEDGFCYVCDVFQDGEHDDDCVLVAARERASERHAAALEQADGREA